LANVETAAHGEELNTGAATAATAAAVDAVNAANAVAGATVDPAAEAATAAAVDAVNAANAVTGATVDPAAEAATAAAVDAAAEVATTAALGAAVEAATAYAMDAAAEDATEAAADATAEEATEAAMDAATKPRAAAVLSQVNSLMDTTLSSSQSALALDGEPTLLQGAWYSVVRLVGKGTYGRVYFVTDKGIQLAVKVFASDVNGVRADCLREIGYLQQCQHSNIIQTYRPVIHESLVYLFMEAMEHDLGAFCRLDVAPTPASRRRLAVGIARGIAHLHERSIMHRDLKPANILVKRGEAKLADFGLARRWTAGRAYTLLVCTLWYRAPELLLGDEKYTPAVDMWSFGLILLELTASRACLPGASDDAQLALVVRVFGRPTNATWPGVERLPGYPGVERAGVAAMSECAARLVTASGLVDGEAAAARGALRYSPARRLCAREVVALLEDASEVAANASARAQVVTTAPRGHGLGQPSALGAVRGELAGALRDAVATHRLGWDALNLAAWVAERYSHTPSGMSHLAPPSGSTASIGLIAHVAVAIAAKTEGFDEVAPVEGANDMEQQVLEALDFELPRA